MHISKLGGTIGACALLAVPAAGFAASGTTGYNGRFTGTTHYQVTGKAQTAALTITVARHNIRSVDLLAASTLPVDAKHSHG